MDYIHKLEYKVAEYAARELVRFISEISLREHSHPWSPGIELILWAVIDSSPQESQKLRDRYHLKGLNKDDTSELNRLSKDI